MNLSYLCYGYVKFVFTPQACYMLRRNSIILDFALVLISEVFVGWAMSSEKALNQIRLNKHRFKIKPFKNTWKVIAINLFILSSQCVSWFIRHKLSSVFWIINLFFCPRRVNNYRPTWSVTAFTSKRYCVCQTLTTCHIALDSTWRTLQSEQFSKTLSDSLKCYLNGH